MPEQKRTTETRYLSGQGEVEWSQLRKEAGGLTCAWADYDGFHIGPCPDEAPPYSHIWGVEPRRRGAAARQDRRGQGDSGMATENPERREEGKGGAHGNPAGPHLETRPRTPKNQLRRRESKLARKNAIGGGPRRKPGDIHERRKWKVLRVFMKPVEPGSDEGAARVETISPEADRPSPWRRFLKAG